MTEFDTAIAKARAEHLRMQQHRQMTFYDSCRKVHGDAYLQLEQMNKDRLANYLKILDGFGCKEYVRWIYVPIMAKFSALKICDLICDMFRDSRIKCVREHVGNIRARRLMLHQEFESAHIAEHARECAETMADNWLADGFLDTLKSLQGSFLPAIRGKSKHIDSVTEDLVAWVLAMRTLCKVIMAHDEELVERMNNIVGKEKHFFIINQADVSRKLYVYLGEILKTYYGKAIAPESAAISAWEAEVMRTLYRTNAMEYLAEYIARKNSAENNTPCESERCRDCDQFRCRRYIKSFSIIEKEARQSCKRNTTTK